jgi:hypothetical protein
MKTIKLLLLLSFLILNSFIAIGQSNQKERKVIYPEEKFDVDAAKKGLEKGTASIKGILFTRERTKFGFKPLAGKKIYGPNIVVYLFPVTSYLDSWYELRRKKENKRIKVDMSEEAYKKCVETKTDDNGNFVFPKLKPGRYFLQSFIHSEYDYHRSVDTGMRDVNSAGDVTAYYKNVYYTNEQDERIEKFVDINNEGDIIEIKLK